MRQRAQTAARWSCTAPVVIATVHSTSFSLLFLCVCSTEAERRPPAQCRGVGERLSHPGLRWKRLPHTGRVFLRLQSVHFLSSPPAASDGTQPVIFVLSVTLLCPGEFLFGQRTCTETNMAEKPAEVLYQSQWEESLVRGGEDEEEQHFAMLMENLGGNSVFEE